MGSFLETILEEKRREVAALKVMSRGSRPWPKRAFVKALDKAGELTVIAEIKKASPSKGLICKDFDPKKIAGRYEKGGASALSVLTDRKFFQGHTDFLMTAREAVGLPVLRKDFIIDPLQVEETVRMGADAMLLIAEALSGSQLRDLYQAALELDLEVLIELHGAKQLDKVMKVNPPVIGINNRDLFTFVTDLNVSIDLIKHIPKEILVVSESGIKNRKDAEKLKSAGVKALLVGESLMCAPDIDALMKELRLAS
jgi:indole-3-glycerol phosphate synthase